MTKQVHEVMLNEPLTVSPDTLLGEAGQQLMSSKQKVLPVVNAQGTVCGVLSERDIRLAADSPLEQETPQEIYSRLQNHQVREVMVTVIHTIEADAPLVEAAQLMRVADVTGLPVVEYDDTGNEEKLVGLITNSHLLDVLISMLEAEGE